MIRPSILLFFVLLLLVSCTPSLNRNQNYAERISDNHFRSTFVYGKDQLETPVVSVQAGTTSLFEREEISKSNMRVLVLATDVNNGIVVHDKTSQYKQVKARAPKGWIVRSKTTRAKVVFDSSVESLPEFYGFPFVRRMGGNYEIKTKGIYTLSGTFEVSVPRDAEPGRHLVEVEFRKSDERSYLLEDSTSKRILSDGNHYRFIVEVL